MIFERLDRRSLRCLPEVALDVLPMGFGLGEYLIRGADQIFLFERPEEIAGGDRRGILRDDEVPLANVLVLVEEEHLPLGMDFAVALQHLKSGSFAIALDVPTLVVTLGLLQATFSDLRRHEVVVAQREVADRGTAEPVLEARRLEHDRIRDDDPDARRPEDV